MLNLKKNVMGKIKNNVVTKGFSGKFGDDLVFRQVDNQTIFAKRTLTPSVASPLQTEVRNRFTEATQFASAAIDNPQAFADYQLMAQMQGLKSAYIAAITDCLTLPEIGSVFTASYKGNVGDTLSIKPKIAYKITSINVSILDAAGNVIESGVAVANGLKWRYTATVANANVKGSKLVLVASDRQKKESTFQQVL
jgi:hypothetical protein